MKKNNYIFELFMVTLNIWHGVSLKIKFSLMNYVESLVNEQDIHFNAILRYAKEK